ncbi:TetR family transcriptional regulator [Actinosynnema sp. NPDC023587]|uniref:TetR/AcrR family transcriptional regulator n=1 Tax=Actinosynnema sp. NPDC023587 TaxID=3154695 RepID=UPI003400D162
MTRPAGLRERKKPVTRTALADAALRLCVDHGVDGVTVEQVAREAGVSLRTFFNYFSSKEEAVVGAFVRRPAAEPVLEALRQALGELVPARFDRVKLEQMRVLRRTPSLLPHLMSAFHAQEKALADAVAARVGADPEADLYPAMFAATVPATLRVVITWWLDTDDRRPPAYLIGTVVARLDAGFAPGAARRG